MLFSLKAARGVRLMGNRTASGYAPVSTDEEAPPTHPKTPSKQLPVTEQVEPIASNGAGAAPPKKDAKTESKAPEKSRFSSESLRDTIRILKLVVPFVWPKDSA